MTKEIILSNGTKLTPLDIVGEKRYVQDYRRDVLSFVFGNISLDELDAIFTETSCETITVVEGGNEYVYNGYTIRVGLEKKRVVIQEGTADSEAVTVTRVTISMAQRTYSETKLANIAQENIDTQLAVAELAELIMGGAE